MLIIITGFLLILAIIFIKYKPVYEVTIAGEKLGYIEKVDEFKNLIEEKIINQEGEYIENISLIQEPEYSFKLLKRTSNLNTDEVEHEKIYIHCYLYNNNLFFIFNNFI